MKTAAIYCRVSTDEQEREGTSLDSQREACLSKARELGYATEDRFVISEVYSGLRIDRPKLTHLREWVRNKEVDAVIAYCLDRLSRDPRDFFILQVELEKEKVALIFVTEDIDNSDLGRLMVHARVYAGKLEADKIRERTMGGKMRVAAKGRIPQAFGRYGGYFGTTYRNGRFEHNSQIVIAHEILRRYLSGESRNNIVRDLQTRDVRGAAGGLIHASAVARVLHNAYVYAGMIRWNGIDIPHKIDPIISEEDALAIERRLKHNKEKSYGFGKRKWLTGRVFCGACGRRYALDKKGCHCSANSSVSPVRCHSPRVGLKELTALAYGVMIVAMSEPETVMERAKVAHDVWEQHRMEFEKLRGMSQDTERHRETRRRALSLQHEMGGISDEEYEKRLSQIRKEGEHELSIGQEAFLDEEPPTPQQVQTAYNRLAAYKPLRLHFGEVLENSQDQMADDLAQNVGLKVIIHEPKEPNHKFSARVVLNLPIPEEDYSFPSQENPMAMVSRTSGYCAFPLPLSLTPSWHVPGP